MRRSCVALLLLLLNLYWDDAVHATPAARPFTVEVSITPARAAAGANVTLQAHTRIGAACVPSVLYDDGSRPAALSKTPQRAGRNGIVRWRWRVQTTASGGTGSIGCIFKGEVRLGQARFMVVHPTPPAIPTRGTSPNVYGVAVTANGIRADQGGLFPPGAGDQFAVVRITIVNNGTGIYDYTPFDFFLEDGGDHVQHQGNTLDSNIQNSALQAGTLGPGQRVTGDVAFEVPSKEQRFILWWQPAFLSAKVRIPIT